MRDRSGIAVIGAGGHGKVMISTLQAAGMPVAGIVDRDSELWGETVLGVEVLGGLEELTRQGLTQAVLAIGDNRSRRSLAEELTEWGLDWRAVAHPAAAVHASVHLGAGSVIFAGAVVQPDTRIGRHSIVNSAASVDHDCRLGDFVHIAPGAHVAGDVTLGTGAFIGVGCSILPGVKIGEWAVVGAGAAVIRDVSDNAIVKGVPAR